jgi:hypothetical protein
MHAASWPWGLKAGRWTVHPGRPTRAAALPQFAHHRSPLLRPSWAPSPAHYHRSLSHPPPPQAPTGAPQATRRPPRWASTSEQCRSRPEIHGSAVPHRRHFLRPVQAPKLNPRWARTTPPPFPGQIRPPPAFNSAVDDAQSAQGPHCFFSVLSREFSLNQGPLRNFV